MFVVVLMSTDNDIDGVTLPKLTELMITQLFPTMKIQLQFIDARKALLGRDSAVTTDDNAPVAGDNRPAASSQNGYGRLEHFITTSPLLNNRVIIMFL